MWLALFAAFLGCESREPRASARHDAGGTGATAAPTEASPPGTAAAPVVRETAVPQIEVPVARCPGDRPAPRTVQTEVARMLEVATKHASHLSNGVGAHAQILNVESWLLDEGQPLPVVSVRYRIRQLQREPIVEDEPGGADFASRITAARTTCMAMRLVPSGDGARLDFPRYLPEMDGSMTALDETHRNDPGNSGPFVPTGIPIAELRATSNRDGL